MRVNEIITEVGDSHYDVDRVYHKKASIKNSKAQYKLDLPNERLKTGFQFSTPDGTGYGLNLSKIKGAKTGKMGLNVEFFVLDDEFPYDINGKGNALKVFSTVKATIAKYISEDPSIEGIIFARSEEHTSELQSH